MIQLFLLSRYSFFRADRNISVGYTYHPDPLILHLVQTHNHQAKKFSETVLNNWWL